VPRQGLKNSTKWTTYVFSYIWKHHKGGTLPARRKQYEAFSPAMQEVFMGFLVEFLGRLNFKALD
jgi:hypothetical protein